jgi:hypothetical protein
MTTGPLVRFPAKRTPQRRRRVLEAILHVDFGLDPSRLHPAGERADRLARARRSSAIKPSIRPRWRTRFMVFLGPGGGSVAL